MRHVTALGITLATVVLARDLRRACFLAFYGAEDLTPSSFYSKDDAVRARNGAALTVRLVGPLVPEPS